MNATTLRFSPRAPLITRLEGLPPQIELDPTTLDVTALALANLAGESWEHLTPTRKEEFRQWAMFAAVASDPEGLRLLAYSMGRTLDPTFDAPDARGFRLGRVDALMGALRGASARVVGVCARAKHASLVALMRVDSAWLGGRRS